MNIRYANRTIEKECTDFTVAKKKFGLKMTEAVFSCIRILENIESMDELLKYRVKRCHLLKGKRNGQYAMDLIGPYRIILRLIDKQNAVVMEIVDYH